MCLDRRHVQGRQKASSKQHKQTLFFKFVAINLVPHTNFANYEKQKKINYAEAIFFIQLRFKGCWETVYGMRYGNGLYSKDCSYVTTHV